MSTQWFIKRGNWQQGPLTSQDLRELSKKGEVRSTDLIRKSDMESWVPAAKVKGLFTSIPEVAARSPKGQIPPKTSPQVSNSSGQQRKSPSPPPIPSTPNPKPSPTVQEDKANIESGIESIAINSEPTRKKRRKRKGLFRFRNLLIAGVVCLVGILSLADAPSFLGFGGANQFDPTQYPEDSYFVKGYRQSIGICSTWIKDFEKAKNQDEREFQFEVNKQRFLPIFLRDFELQADMLAIAEHNPEVFDDPNIQFALGRLAGYRDSAPKLGFNLEPILGENYKRLMGYAKPSLTPRTLPKN